MAGFLCIAMMKDSPYFMTAGITEYEPDVWAETLLLPSHLLCYEGFHEPEEVESLYLQELLKIGVEAKSGKSFKANPDDIIRVFLRVRDHVLQLQNEGKSHNIPPLQSVDYLDDDFLDNIEDTREEREKLYDAAKEQPFASERAFQLYQQAAQQGYQRAYVALAHAYFNGWGTKRNISSALKWMRRSLEDIHKLHPVDKIELGELLHNLATEYENGSDQVIPDLVKAYQLNLQSADLGCELAYTSLACAYLAGEGVEKI